MSNLTFFKILDLSTDHISERTKTWLDDYSIHPAKTLYAGNPPRNNCEVVIFSFWPYGWLVVAHDPSELTDATPEDLRNVIAFAHAHGADWIKLDDDGDLIDELPTFVKD